MDSQYPVARRDVVALFLYVSIVAQTLIALVQILGARVAMSFLIPPTSSRSGRGVVDFFPLISLLFVPFVPLIASAVVGRYAESVVTKRDLRALVLACTGLTMCALSLPFILTASYYWYYFAKPNNIRGVVPLFQANLIGYLSTFSLGFVLAFLPTIVDTIRTRANVEEDSSTF